MKREPFIFKVPRLLVFTLLLANAGNKKSSVTNDFLLFVFFFLSSPP